MGECHRNRRDGVMALVDRRSRGGARGSYKRRLLGTTRSGVDTKEEGYHVDLHVVALDDQGPRSCDMMGNEVLKRFDIAEN